MRPWLLDGREEGFVEGLYLLLRTASPLRRYAAQVSMMWATSISHGHLVVQVSHVAQSQMAFEVSTASLMPSLDEAHDLVYGKSKNSVYGHPAVQLPHW